MASEAAGADPNVHVMNGATPLYKSAARRAALAIIKTLLTAGADPNARAEDGAAPLHRAAAKNGNPVVVEALLMAGADPDARTEDGATPLHLVTRRPFRSFVWLTVETLLDAGADPRAKDDNGKTPFDYIRGEEGWKETRVYRRLMPFGRRFVSRVRGWCRSLRRHASRR